MISPIEPLEETYQRWWDPRRRPAYLPAWLAPPQDPPPPHCGRWYPVDEPVPATAQWALVYLGRPPRVLYAKSHGAALSFFGELALRDHPHVRLVPVSKAAPDALAALLKQHAVHDMVRQRRLDNPFFDLPMATAERA